jgi:hypothetical protein
LRDDNHQHYHGVVRLAENPLVLELRWKPKAKSAEQMVGLYRLHLKELLAHQYIRPEGAGGDQVRVRFFRGAGGTVYLQVHSGSPQLAVGRITL